MNKYSINQKYRVVAILALLLTLAVNLISLSSVAQAAGGPPPGGGPGSRKSCKPGSSDWPQCEGAGLQVNTAWSPSIGVSGQPFTYTLSLTNGGVQTASNIELDLQMVNNQKLTSFEPSDSNWTLLVPPNQITDTVRIKVTGTLQPGKTSSSVTLVTTFPDLNQTIMRQYATASWNDTNGFTSRGRLMVISVQPNQVTPVASGSSGTTTPVPNPNQATSLSNAAIPFAPVTDPGNNGVSEYNWYFAATGHTLNDQLGFLTYWLEHGSVAVLGYPLSEVFTDQSGMEIQYFERGVLEYHPNNPDPYKVELRSLGREENEAQSSVSPNSSALSVGSIYYPQTGHWLDGPFVNYWQQNGGLAQFGYPISEPIVQADGKVVQWFERARLELTYTTTNYPLVQLGLVGREYAVKQGYLPY